MIRQVTFVFVLLMSANSLDVFAQNLNVIDSLKSALVSQSESEKFETLNALGFEYRYSYPDSTIYFCSQAYDLGKSIELTKNLSKPLSFIGLAYAAKGEYRKSAEYHDQAIEVARSQQDSVQLGFGYNNLGRMFFDGGDLVRAFNNFIYSKDIFEALQEKSGLAYVYRSLANIYKSQNDYAEAIEMSTKAFELRKELDDKRGIVSSLLELALIYELMGDNMAALEKLSMANNVASQINDRATKTELALAEAEILFVEKKYEDSYSLVKQILRTASEITNQKLYMRASLLRGKYLMQQKQYTQAIPVFEEVIQRAEDAGHLNFQIDGTKNAAACYKAIGNLSKANYFMNQYLLLQEQVKNTDLLREIEGLKFQLVIEKKEKENELLLASQIKNETQLAAQRFQNRLLVGLVITVTGVMVVFVIFNRKRKRINQKLQDQNEKILKQQEEISKVNDNLKQHNQQLNELNNEKNTLMYIVAHDLKSPLNRISGLANIMEMEGGLPPEQQEYLRMIKTATKSGTSLIVDLLDVNSFEQNGSAPSYSTFHPGILLEERADSFKVSADIKSIQLHVEQSFSEVFTSDPDFINRIIENLISNALKFSPKHSSILVTGRLENGVAVFSVKDSGPGFSEADRSLLFQKFKKLSAQPTGGESSNGLGLAIVKTLVDRLGGKIELISEQGKGSEFIIKIPPARMLVGV